MKKFLLSLTSLVLVVSILTIVATTFKDVDTIWHEYPTVYPPSNGYYVILTDLNEQMLSVWVDSTWYVIEEEWTNEKHIIDNVSYWSKEPNK